MEWKFCNKKGIISEEPTTFQVDSVGNILQLKGGVNPKACQKCKKIFKSKIIETPITQKVPIFTCATCNFKSAGSGNALDHKIETDHKLKKILKDRIVSTTKTLEGVIPVIKHSETECYILCQECEKL